MLLSHAPPPRPFLNTLLHHFHYHHRPLCSHALSSISHFTTLSISHCNPSLSHSRRASLFTMNKASLAAAASPDHVAGDWYSVPELRLREHRFTVPLDYSRGPHSSPKISVFAREVVAGNSTQLLIVSNFDANRLLWHLVFLICLRICFCMDVS